MEKFTYRVGYPGWKLLARLGIPLRLVVEVAYDSECGYFTAFSNDFNPESAVAAEAKTWSELVVEVNNQIEEAMEFIFKKNKRRIRLRLLPQLEQKYPLVLNL